MSDAKIGAVHAEASLGVASWQKSLDQLSRSTRVATTRVNKEFQTTTTATQRLERSMGNLARAAAGPLAAALSVRTVQRFTAETLKSADALQKMSRQVGLGTSEFQSYSQAAERAGMQTNNFERSLGTFAQRVGEARKEQGSLNTALKDTDKALLDNVKNAKNQREALELMADAIAGAEDQTERLRLANAAFGRQGREMVEFLQHGREGLRQYEQRAQALGHVLSKEALDGVEDFNDAVADLNKTIRTQIQEGLLTTFTKDTGALSEVAKDKDFHQGLQAIGGGIAWIGQQAAGTVTQLGNVVELMNDPSWANFRAVMQTGIGGLAQGAAQTVGGWFGDSKPETMLEAAKQLQAVQERIAETERTIAQYRAQGYESGAQEAERQLASLRQQEAAIHGQMAALDELGTARERNTDATLDAIVVTGQATEATDTDTESNNANTNSLGGRASAVSQLEASYEALEARLDPLGAAHDEFNGHMETLNKALDAGIVGYGEYLQQVARLESVYADTLDPLAATLEGLDEQIKLTRMSSEEAAIYSDVQAHVNELRAQGVELTAAEIDAIEGKVRALHRERGALDRNAASMQRYGSAQSSMGMGIDGFTNKLFDAITDPSKWNMDSVRGMANDLAMDFFQVGMSEALGGAAGSGMGQGISSVLGGILGQSGARPAGQSGGNILNDLFSVGTSMAGFVEMGRGNGFLGELLSIPIGGMSAGTTLTPYVVDEVALTDEQRTQILSYLKGNSDEPCSRFCEQHGCVSSERHCGVSGARSTISLSEGVLLTAS
ncbi:hypothetical protein [Aquibaculum sediminis]|uniref:hypothetical protein n=1 Tax=Aquibaculum sediminis TaxID=3231907 RepID=UPI0034522A7D